MFGVFVYVCVCVCFVYLHHDYQFHRKNLVLQHVINKYDFCKRIIFDIGELSIQCNKDSCCEHITIGENIYLYGVSVYWPLSELCVCDI